MTIDQVISGGQIGADIAGVRAAKACGIDTGGFMPKGRRTTLGPMPSDVFEEFGFVETDVENYPHRTELNVATADLTIRLAYTFSSPGEKCTLRYLRQYHKPYI